MSRNNMKIVLGAVILSGMAVMATPITTRHEWEHNAWKQSAPNHRKPERRLRRRKC